VGVLVGIVVVGALGGIVVVDKEEVVLMLLETVVDVVFSVLVVFIVMFAAKAVPIKNTVKNRKGVRLERAAFSLAML